MKKIFISFILFSLLVLSACKGNRTTKKSEEKAGPVIVASTSWTAAFADIAGADKVEIIAPANLRHPPEYEITVDDIVKIQNSQFFIFAGFERMMKTLGDAVGETQMVKIRCDNSYQTVASEAGKIAELLGTKDECEKRLASDKETIEQGKKILEEKSLAGVRVLCNANQIYLAKDLGLEIAGTFGPGPVTSDQIADAKTAGYVYIIDNVHNPVGGPLAEVAPDSKYIIWRNFPESVKRAALEEVISKNIEQL
jgi:hypothetical protein